MSEIEVYGATAEVPLVASGFPTLRVRGVSAEAVTTATHPSEIRLLGASAEVVLYKRPPPSWLPRYLFDGAYWIPLFPVVGTPNEGVGLVRDAPFTLRSPDGVRWRLSVGDDGALTTEAIFESALQVVNVSHGGFAMSSSGEQTVDRPQGVEEGDLLIAQVVHRSGTGESTPPNDSSWTLLRRDKNPATVSGIDQYQEIWTRVVGDINTEPDTYTWRFGATLGVGVTAVRNRGGGVAIEDSAHLGTSSRDHSAPSVTSQGEDRLLLKFGHCVYTGGLDIGGWLESQIGNNLYGGDNQSRFTARYGPVTEAGATGAFYWEHYIAVITIGQDHDGGTTTVLLRTE